MFSTNPGLISQTSESSDTDSPELWRTGSEWDHNIVTRGWITSLNDCLVYQVLILGRYRVTQHHSYAFRLLINWLIIINSLWLELFPERPPPYHRYRPPGAMEGVRGGRRIETELTCHLLGWECFLNSVSNNSASLNAFKIRSFWNSEFPRPVQHCRVVIKSWHAGSTGYHTLTVTLNTHLILQHLIVSPVTLLWEEVLLHLTDQFSSGTDWPEEEVGG